MANPAPSVNGSAKTQFKKGNPGGPGHPFGVRLEKLRKSLLATIEKRGIEKITEKLIHMAEGGDVAAIKIVLQYAIGQPTQPIEMSGSLATAAPVIVVRDFGGSDDGKA